ncbi:MAG: cupin domain-containing protein [Myxococcales bacterium]|nr:cupin domain-containing protein [Myxococcales bacterium]
MTAGLLLALALAAHLPTGDAPVVVLQGSGALPADALPATTRGLEAEGIRVIDRAALEEAAGASIERVAAPEEHTGAGLRAGPRAEVEIFTPHPVATAYGTRLNLANGKEHCARLITLDAGKQVALRKYTRAERTFHVLEGKVVLELPDQEDEDHVLRPGRSVTMPPHVRYRMSAVGAARVLVIWAGADDDDVEA